MELRQEKISNTLNSFNNKGEIKSFTTRFNNLVVTRFNNVALIIFKLAKHLFISTIIEYVIIPMQD